MRFALLGVILTASIAAAPVPFTVSAGAAPVTIDFNGYTEEYGTVTGLTSRLTFSNFTFTNLATTTRVQFRLAIENTSSAPVTASRVSTVGFRTSPDVRLTGSSVSGGTFSRVNSGNMPSGIGRVDFCFTSVNCAGGGSGGVTRGNTGTVYASLLFAGSGLTSLTFDDVFVRYQSISGVRGVTSAVGAPISGAPVPEPSAYVVLLSGALLIVQRVRARRSIS